MPPREIIIEQVRIGAAIRVTATDTETGTEVVFQASAAASPLEIERLAGSKMGYVLRRQGGR